MSMDSLSNSPEKERPLALRCNFNTIRHAKEHGIKAATKLALVGSHPLEINSYYYGSPSRVLRYIDHNSGLNLLEVLREFDVREVKRVPEYPDEGKTDFEFKRHADFYIPSTDLIITERSEFRYEKPLDPGPENDPKPDELKLYYEILLKKANPEFTSKG